jgi:hypothetical protein
MRGKNPLYPFMVKMMNSCSIYSSCMTCYSLVSYPRFEFVGLYDQTLAWNLWVAKSMSFA